MFFTYRCCFWRMRVFTRPTDCDGKFLNNFKQGLPKNTSGLGGLHFCCVGVVAHTPRLLLIRRRVVLLETGVTSMVELLEVGEVPGEEVASTALLLSPAVGSAKGKGIDWSLPSRSSELSPAKATALEHSSSAASSASRSGTTPSLEKWLTSSPSPTIGKAWPSSESTSESMAAARR